MSPATLDPPDPGAEHTVADVVPEDRRHLLVISHSRSGSTQALTEAALAGASDPSIDGVELRSLGAFDADADDVRWAHGVILATPANFGYMSGALKDFFDRIYHRCLDHTRGLPYAVIVKGDTDVDGALAAVHRIVTGLGWREVASPLGVVGPVTPDDLAAATELGATIAAGLSLGMF